MDAQKCDGAAHTCVYNKMSSPRTPVFEFTAADHRWSKLQGLDK